MADEYFYTSFSCILPAIGFTSNLILIGNSPIQDEDAFFADYTEAHLKLSELGYLYVLICLPLCHVKSSVYFCMLF